MKKYILITLVTIAAFSATLVSCSDEFVNRSAVYSIDSENYFNSKSDYDSALTAAYKMLQSSYVNVLLGEIASDNTLAGGESQTDVPGFQQIDAMTHTPVNSNLKDIWDWMFAGVQRCNYILEFKDKTNFVGKNQVLAETRFLRAYYQFELVKWFGGIPLSGDKRFKVGDEKSIARATVNEVYAVIVADLIFAKDNLAATPSQTGRVTKGAALALLGKAYLYQKDYANSGKYLDELIATSTYSLVKDYNSIFEIDGENGAESVFEIQYTDIEGASFNCLQCSQGNVAVGFSGIRNYSGSLFSSGFSFNIPTQKIVNAFEAGDSRKAVAILDIEAWVASTGASYGKGYNHTGFFNRKYIPRKRSATAAGDLNLTNPNNYRSIRYADVLLMAAEAATLRTDSGKSDTKAQGYLNTVRDRAFGDTNHRITATGLALRDFIWAERRVELAGEGHRFFDLVRTGKAAQEITGFTAGKNELFPIPFEEIQFANGNWQQNTGY